MVQGCTKWGLSCRFISIFQWLTLSNALGIITSILGASSCDKWQQKVGEGPLWRTLKAQDRQILKGQPTSWWAVYWPSSPEIFVWNIFSLLLPLSSLLWDALQRQMQCKFAPTCKVLGWFLLFGVAFGWQLGKGQLCAFRNTHKPCQRNHSQSPLLGIHSLWVSHNFFWHGRCHQLCYSTADLQGSTQTPMSSLRLNTLALVAVVREASSSSRETPFLQGCWSSRSGTRSDKAVKHSRHPRPRPQQAVTGLALVTPGCSRCRWGVHTRVCRHARTQRLCWTARATNRFYWCRCGKHRASGIVILQFSYINGARSGVPWESWQMGPTEGKVTYFSCSDISASYPGAGQPLSKSHDVQWPHRCWKAIPKLTNP